MKVLMIICIFGGKIQVPLLPLIWSLPTLDKNETFWVIWKHFPNQTTNNVLTPTLSRIMHLKLRFRFQVSLTAKLGCSFVLRSIQAWIEWQWIREKGRLKVYFPWNIALETAVRAMKNNCNKSIKVRSRKAKMSSS